MSPRVVLIMASEAIGGEERYFIELATALAHRSERCLLVNLKSSTPYSDGLGTGVELRAGLAPNRTSVAGLWRLIRLLRREKPRVVLINGNRQAIWLGSIAAKLARAPVVLVHTHAHMGLYAGSLRFAARHLGHVIAASEHHARTLCGDLGLPEERVHVIRPGIDLSRTRPAFEDADVSPATADQRHGQPPEVSKPLVVGIVAALRPEKDHATFLEAARLVLEASDLAGSGRRVVFHLIGDGDRRPELEALAGRLGILDAVSFRGWRAVDSELMGELDVLVLSSRSETFPAVLIEGMSAGVPVVATNVGSVSEVLGRPPVGELVPPGDSAALSLAVRKMLASDAHRRRAARAGLRRAELFSSDRFAGDVLRLATELSGGIR